MDEYSFLETGLAFSKDLDHSCLKTGLLAASRAGEIIAKYFKSGCSVRDKGIGELVTTADLEAENAIGQTLTSSFPSHVMLAEESAKELDAITDLWIVDPLDGTNNFAHHLPHFAVSIAYAHQNKVELGIILQPILNEWYIAVRGQGAFFNGIKCQVNNHERLDQTMIACGFYYDRGAMMEATLEAIKNFFYQKIHGIRRFGTASLDLGMVGRGIFGAYFEYQLHPWDHAAGGLFVEEAGGSMTDCEGEPLQLYKKTSILASNSKLHTDALKIAKKEWTTYQESC